MCALIIPLQPDYESADTDYIKHSRKTTNADGSEEYEEERIPRLNDGATPYFILYFLSCFDCTRRNFRWNTGARLFTKFGSHLAGTYLEDWNNAIADLDEPDRTVEAFDEELLTFKESVLAGYSYADQMEGLRKLKKPVDMKPSEFGRLFRKAERMACQLPDADENPGFSNVERNRVYLEAMPKTWKKNFDNAGKSAATENFTSIQSYMDTQAKNDPPRKSTRTSNAASNNSSRSNNNRGNNRRRGNRNRNRNRNRRNNDDDDNGSRYSRNRSNNRQGQRSHDYNLRPRNESNAAEATSGSANNSGSNNNSNSGSRNAESNFIEQMDPSITSDDDYAAESFFIDNGVQEELEPELYDNLADSVPALVSPRFDFYDSDSDSDSESDDDSVVTSAATFPFFTPARFTPEADVEKRAEHFETHDYAPKTIAVIKQINDTKQKGTRYYKSLFDGGGSHVLINKRCLPRGH